ncbi:hypothetical protein BG006_009162 [Podila minutissima]|uniref:Uncharacterized protein n=1 Tax=Podila minutissima TaxID=64525 RepID=A0A9P5SHJ0_9FUNG|nr:hypothetical protein BG006_009162 [Podila minutissima]
MSHRLRFSYQESCRPDPEAQQQHQPQQVLSEGLAKVAEMEELLAECNADAAKA